MKNFLSLLSLEGEAPAKKLSSLLFNGSKIFTDIFIHATFFFRCHHRLQQYFHLFPWLRRSFVDDEKPELKKINIWWFFSLFPSLNLTQQRRRFLLQVEWREKKTFQRTDECTLFLVCVNIHSGVAAGGYIVTPRLPPPSSPLLASTKKNFVIIMRKKTKRNIAMSSSNEI